MQQAGIPRTPEDQRIASFQVVEPIDGVLSKDGIGGVKSKQLGIGCGDEILVRIDVDEWVVFFRINEYEAEVTFGKDF